MPALSDPVLGFVGYGRFGRALAEIFAGRGYSVRAYDPSAEVPAEARCATLEELTAVCQVVFVAVPIALMREVFLELRAHVTEAHAIIDVGSVKVEPVGWMGEVFGSQIPWVGTHPLFGPVSLARGEGLRAVVCPNPLWPEAEMLAAELFRSIGATVIRMDAEGHDRTMAQTHALAFFIAKGLLDVGVPTDSPAAPPSFQAMARTIEAVRGDAGHLLLSLHRENPYSAEYRTRLLQTLLRLDGALDRDAEPGPTPPQLTIEAPSAIPDLRHTRDRIDELDREIVGLLTRRAELSRRAHQAKKAVGRDIVDPVREESLLADRGDWAEECGLDGASVVSVFSAILAMSRKIQQKS